MKSFPLFFLAFFILHNLFSQTKSKDDLLKIEIQKKISPFLKNSNLLKASKFYFEKNWDSTIVYTDKVLNLSKGNSHLNNYTHFFRGHSFKNKKLNNEAEIQFKQISKDFEFYYIVKMYLGELALINKDYEKAISILKELTKLSNEKYSYIKRKNILNNIGISYLLLKNFKDAEIYFKESIKNEKDTIELIGNYINIANLYYERYIDNIAIKHFNRAYNLSKAVKLLSNVSNTYDYQKNKDILTEKERTAFNMSVVEENRKDFEKALMYMKEAQQWKDSLNDQNKIYAVAQKEKEFAVQQKQNEVDILQVQNELKETQRNIFLYSALGLFILLGIAVYFYREKVKSNKIIASQKETLDELNTTKDKLFSIVSHDLRSSVNALKSSNKVLIDNLESKNLTALENLLQKNSSIVNGAYGLLDNLLNWALLQTEQQYFYIDKHRLFIIAEHVSYNYQPLLLEKELSFENTVSKKEVIYADQESLKIVLRNLLDNAIKFSKPNGSIKIYSRNSSEDYCDLVIEDTGLGMSEETRLKLLEDSVLLNKKEHEDVIGTGLGLQLCKSMIKKNHGKFDIESELGKGTKMIVSLPKTPLNG
ncbi:tetratricopeptide repeat-containing sensor histidine kinase [uncultured Tenacibaculum sp.]|uniref:tetratricopeptide repeat-containing sensor histidine kinase n=1 Tax=uncultured Tenacibaculum sp. TaxID=174713 RepID=UPI002603802A|nr:tetratricopeptide repeat-containing sensor histidine kinase [uncultured Tenacibaculum sp.]